jgi:hypothetical protein
VNFLRAANESNGSQPEAPFVQSLPRCLNNFGVISQTKIIVRAKVQHLISISRSDMCALRRAQQALGLKQTLGANRLELFLKVILKTIQHNDKEYRSQELVDKFVTPGSIISR